MVWLRAGEKGDWKNNNNNNNKTSDVPVIAEESASEVESEIIGVE